MSVSLSLVFDRYALGHVLASNRLSLWEQNSELFSRIKDEAVPLPDGIDWDGYSGMGRRKEDQYDEPLAYLPAHSVARHLSKGSLQHPWDRAVLAFVSGLPPDTKVVLWWH